MKKEQRRHEEKKTQIENIYIHRKTVCLVVVEITKNILCILCVFVRRVSNRNSRVIFASSFIFLLLFFFLFFLNQNIHDWSLALHKPDYWHTVFLLFRKENEKKKSPLSLHTHTHTQTQHMPKSCLLNVFIRGHCILLTNKSNNKKSHFTYTIVCASLFLILSNLLSIFTMQEKNTKRRKKTFYQKIKVVGD